MSFLFFFSLRVIPSQMSGLWQRTFPPPVLDFADFFFFFAFVGTCTRTKTPNSFESALIHYKKSAIGISVMISMKNGKNATFREYPHLITARPAPYFCRPISSYKLRLFALHLLTDKWKLGVYYATLQLDSRKKNYFGKILTYKCTIYSYSNSVFLLLYYYPILLLTYCFSPTIY